MRTVAYVTYNVIKAVKYNSYSIFNIIKKANRVTQLLLNREQ